MLVLDNDGVGAQSQKMIDKAILKLKEAGNNVEHIEYDNAVHGFISWPLEIKLTKKAIEHISKSIKKIIK